LAHRRLDARHDVGPQALELFEVALRREDEHAAIPVIAAVGEKRARAGAVRLLDELGDGECLGHVLGLTAPDISVSCGRRRRNDAEGDKPSAPGKLGGAAHGVVKPVFLLDDMIGGQDEQRRIGVLAAEPERGGRDRRRRIARFGLEEVRGRIHAYFAQLLGGEETMLHMRHQHRARTIFQPRHPQHRFLQQRALARKGQELLGKQRARQRPEPGAGAAAQDHRVERHDQ
jgi:hypothetical protein